MHNLGVLGVLAALAAAAIAAPLVAPWRFRVRLLATAPMTDPFTSLGLAPRPDMRVVRLLALESHDGDVEITVKEIDTHRSSHISLARAGCVPAAVAKLDAWMALATPLLLMTDQGHIHVLGPDGAINNLSRNRREGSMTYQQLAWRIEQVRSST